MNLVVSLTLFCGIAAVELAAFYQIHLNVQKHEAGADAISDVSDTAHGHSKAGQVFFLKIQLRFVLTSQMHVH